MKHFTRILKLIIITTVIAIVAMGFIEYARIRESQKTMIMFSRIAGNYALTASQDVGELTGDNRHNGMYDRYEYGVYLSQLDTAASYAETLGDGTLKFASIVLQTDYNNAIGLTDSQYLDEYLQYTPIAFNLPYISQNMLEECYEDAMLQMVRNYKCNGIPSLFVGNDGGNFRISEGDLSVVDISDNSPVYDNGSDMVGFSLVALDDNLIRSIYGNPDYYRDTFEEIFKNIDRGVYDELRLLNYLNNSATTYVPQYNITFSTPWYYVTTVPILCFRPSKMLNTVGLTGASGRISGATNTNVYNRDELRNYTPNGDNYYKDAAVAEGQLMLHLDNFVATTDFQYTFLG